MRQGWFGEEYSAFACSSWISGALPRWALAFKARYQAVNSVEIEELRRTSIEVKLQQTSALMSSVEQFGWEQSLQEEEDEVRQRWILLKGLEPWPI